MLPFIHYQEFKKQSIQLTIMLIAISCNDFQNNNLGIAMRLCQDWLDYFASHIC